MKRLPLESTQLWLTIKCHVLGQYDRRWTVLNPQAFGHPKSAIMGALMLPGKLPSICQPTQEYGTRRYCIVYFVNKDVASVAD